MQRSEFVYLEGMPTNATERLDDLKDSVFVGVDTIVSTFISIAQRHVQATDYEDGSEVIRDSTNVLVSRGEVVNQGAVDLGNEATDLLLNLIIDQAKELLATPPATVEGVQAEADRRLKKDPLKELLDRLSN